MKLLILGGTQFVGRAVAAAALVRGHELTLFHRGRTNPGLFQEVEHLLGDRDGDLSALSGREFDAVIDVSGYTPDAVRASVEALAGMHYVFVSTISVYSDLSTGPDESSPTHTSGDGYGELKAACERELPAGSLVVRPTVVVGPYDPSYRFTYWVDRIARGGDVLAPEPRGDAVQLIDARDLGEWIVRCCERGLRGVFNAAGPAERLTMEQLLETCRRATGSVAELHWVAADVPAGALPFWVDDPAWRGVFAATNARALAEGLTFRPLAETVRDTLTWIHSGDPTFVDQGRPKPGLDPELEQRLLAA